MKNLSIILLVAALSFGTVASAQETTVPEASLPELPEGLEDLFSDEPLAETPEEPARRGGGLPFDLSGFAEGRFGLRLQDDPLQKDISLGEARLQLDAEKSWEGFTLNLVSDFILDPVADDYDIDLERGRGAVDLREANLVFSPLDFVDVKLGRQILTWGTGDLVFINDLFPKDWNSFFIGRDTEYLKAPSDALKVSLFFDAFNVNVVYTPRFDADRFIDGHRVSFFDAMRGGTRGREAPLRDLRPDDWFSDDELAVRLYRSFGAYETALYFYSGYWKSPGGLDPVSGAALFPRLDVYGASVRGPVGAGIGAVELGYYDSADRAASNPLINNSEFRFLVSYEQEIGTEFTAAIQYYLERKLDYDAYLASLPAGLRAEDENRHLITLRLTKLLMNQDLTLSLFNFYSPSDEDGYLRLNVSYKLRDNLRVEAGGNLFYGRFPDSFFGQFEDASNLYTGLRYEF
tara:strand:- start:5718 stop:7100 length:1383 start_codon:yes stop_codon:yes gene_type:complete